MLTHPVFIGDHGSLLLAMNTPLSFPAISNTTIQSVSNSSRLSAAMDHYLSNNRDSYKVGNTKSPAALHRANALVPPQSGQLT